MKTGSSVSSLQHPPHPPRTPTPHSPVYAPVFNFHCNIFLQSLFRSSKWTSSFWLPHQNPLSVSLLHKRATFPALLIFLGLINHRVVNTSGHVIWQKDTNSFLSTQAHGITSRRSEYCYHLLWEPPVYTDPLPICTPPQQQLLQQASPPLGQGHFEFRKASLYFQTVPV